LIVKSMSTKPRTSSRMTAAERRAQVLDATRQVVADRGFHAISIEAVAQQAGITRPVVYEHFTDLAGLLEALVAREGVRAVEQLSRVLPTDLGAGGDAQGRLLSALQGYLEAVRGNPDTWRLVLMPPEGAPPILRSSIDIGRAAVVAQLADAVRPGLVAGRESPDPELTGRMLSTFADDAARLVLTDPEEYPVERLLAHARWLLGQLYPQEASPS
jgi:AcrR family transcriptional regulator